MSSEVKFLEGVLKKIINPLNPFRVSASFSCTLKFIRKFNFF
jgi:hypothetical protein